MTEKAKNIYLLHDSSLKWITELDFITDEQAFLENLLSSHFLELSSSDHYEATRKLIKKLKEVEKTGVELVDTIELHNKHMATLIESKQLEYDHALEGEHEKIQMEFDNYLVKFKYVKKKIFNMIKQIMLDHKQKLLINKT
jgi:hypothetical protein